MDRRASIADLVQTRIATLDDVAELARLNAAFNDVHEPSVRLAARLADPRRAETAILAELQGRAVGFASLRLAPCLFAADTYAELTELYVDQASRRRGVGLALVAHAERLAQQAGAEVLCLLTGFGNQVGQAFYSAAGYQQAQLVMCKRLASPLDAPAPHSKKGDE
jgi:GNAT superfamily N-acetyltransferase